MTGRYGYNSQRVTPRQNLSLRFGMRWLIKRFNGHMKLHEDIADIRDISNIAAALIQHLQNTQEESTLAAEDIEQFLGDNAIENSGKRIRKFVELSKLASMVREKIPSDMSDGELDILYQLFHNLVLSSVYQINLARVQGVTHNPELYADLHFYSRALRSIARSDDVLLFIGHAYPFNEIQI